MFDRTYVRAEVAPAYPQTIHEHRAPTDDSVKLLREMEQAAEKRIVQSTRVENCHIDCVIHQRMDVMNAHRQFAVVFSINGKKQRVDYEHTEWTSANPEDGLIDALVAKVARHIAVEFLGRPFADAMLKARGAA